MCLSENIDSAAGEAHCTGRGWWQKRDEINAVLQSAKYRWRGEGLTARSSITVTKGELCRRKKKKATKKKLASL